MKVELFNITSADIDDLMSFEPREDEQWKAQADVEIGEIGQPGRDRFQFEICSLAWINAQTEQRNALPTGRMIVFKVFTYGELLKVLKQLADDASRNTGDWDSFSRQLNWHLQWELENFRQL